MAWPILLGQKLWKVDDTKGRKNNEINNGKIKDRWKYFTYNKARKEIQ